MIGVKVLGHHLPVSPGSFGNLFVCRIGGAPAPPIRPLDAPMFEVVSHYATLTFIDAQKDNAASILTLSQEPGPPVGRPYRIGFVRLNSEMVNGVMLSEVFAVCRAGRPFGQRFGLGSPGIVPGAGSD